MTCDLPVSSPCVMHLTSRLTASRNPWSTNALRANFPMVVDGVQQRVLVVFRHPATIAAFSVRDGRSVATVKTCGDADDVFFDAKRSRIYVSCGEGSIDVFAWQADSFVSVGRIATAGGARTAFFGPDINRLLLAVRATSTAPAAIWCSIPHPEGPTSPKDAYTAAGTTLSNGSTRGQLHGCVARHKSQHLQDRAERHSSAHCDVRDTVRGRPLAHSASSVFHSVAARLHPGQSRPPTAPNGRLTSFRSCVRPIRTRHAARRRRSMHSALA